MKPDINLTEQTDWSRMFPVNVLCTFIGHVFLVRVMEVELTLDRRTGWCVFTTLSR